MESPRPSVSDSQSVVSAIQLDGLDRRRRSSSSSTSQLVTSLGGERSEKRNLAPYFQTSSRKTSGAPKPVHQDYADHTGGVKLKGQSSEIQPTYRMAPHTDRCFKSNAVKCIMNEALEEALEGIDHYDPVKCRALTSILSEDIKQRVKWLNFERFKLVCLVHIGSINGQAMQIASRCLWNDSVDSFASTCYKKRDMFVVALMFAVYKE